MNAPFTPAPGVTLKNANAPAPELDALHTLQSRILGLSEADPQLAELASKCQSWESVKSGMTPVIDLLPEMGDIAVAADVTLRGF